MNEGKTPRRTLMALLLVALGVLIYMALRHVRVPGEEPPGLTLRAPAAADTASRAPVVPPPGLPPPDTLAARGTRRPAARNVTPARIPILDTLHADLDVLEFMRDFYADVRERTVALTLRGSRLDSAGPSRFALRLDVAGGRTLVVSQFVVAVDSARQLRKYIFPGWGYGSDWVPLPDGSLKLEAAIEPKAGISPLRFAEAKDPLTGPLNRPDDRLSIRLRAPAGYTYFVRFGVRCASPGEGDSAETLYAASGAVEFPSILRSGSLVREAGDTLYLATRDPGSIHEIAASFPGVPIVAVVLDADPDAEWGVQDLTSRSDVAVFLNTTSSPAESFVILSSSKALVERPAADPAFERIIRTRMAGTLRAGGPAGENPARPVLRRTDLLAGSEAVSSLKALFRRYVRESGRQL